MYTLAAATIATEVHLQAAVGADIARLIDQMPAGVMHPDLLTALAAPVRQMSEAEIPDMAITEIFPDNKNNKYIKSAW